jgi:putative ABC transport system permease protein
MVSGFFGLLAALLVSVGVYGVTSFLVARRRKEIGIRRALGAGAGRTAGLVVREISALLGIGVALGTAVSVVAARAAGALLFGLAPHDPATLIGASGLLAMIAAVATAIPARRALRISPMLALREE